jgi:predicted nucleic acid-binding protein
LLDADAVIDYLNGIASTADLIDDLFRQDEVLCTCDVVIAEVYAGLLPAERQNGRTLLGSFRFLPGTARSARQAGVWRYDFRRQGLQLAATDCLIAAIAHAHGATLITGNIRHYPMPELNLRPLPRGYAT